ncbi:inter-alpha-trypsin inhibitor heavy chain H3-like isoform X2 [Phyllopteryx taeniolatus]|uniref:inter-alpha-trypsin inhibitor heavy chain H3-like isoform X2 n=1 Tax=Phyllopteryx taeniolatus TaxID=161469 RepID=UPI002AD4F0C1|nr:inter-alpha-trypsin inhibitor heavy chain H3-like isoform X2 [Phyllopteryx taeniolatus]
MGATMDRTVLQVSIFGLLLAFGTTQPKDDWEIYSFHINSTVISRYATTVITSRVVNRKDEPQEIEFHVRIPKNAFISKFRMFMDDQVYDSVVKAKEDAQQQYTEAVSRGESAGIVSSVGRTLEEFKTSVTVAALKKVTFELTYEELLKRRLGKYELQIHARPMQTVKDFKVDVHIQEEAGVNFLHVNGGLSTGALANAVTKAIADKQAWVHFYPTVEQQKTCDSCGEEGINGDLAIVYDVNRDKSLGDIKTSSGYFVHHFAPSQLSRIPKNVVFVIDKSGSMHGKKIEQTRTALIHILNDLAEEDFFGLITFDSTVSYWKRELVQANSQNVKNAEGFARNIIERGGTNINDALLDGSRMLNDNPRNGSASILILLTDGDPTSGVVNLGQIHANVMEAIQDKFPLYCLGFGFDVNFNFLEKLSLQNNGVARRIYADSDADLQLKGFYDEVANPLLTDVTMIYNGGANLTQTNFSQYYNGSEIVVAGQIIDNNIETFVPRVVAISRNASIVFSEKNSIAESTDNSNIQRVWAYLTVKQLLKKELQLSGAEKEKVKNETLRLSLKYNFVTPLTSMVVTKPTKDNTEVLHKPNEEAPQPSVRTTLGRNNPLLGSVAHDSLVRHSTRVLHRIPALAGRSGSPGHPPSLGGYVLSATPMLDMDHDMTGRSSGHVHKRLQHVPNILATSIPVVPPLIRFLLQAESQSLPLCFDIPAQIRLRLLLLPSAELSVNGELDGKRGFNKIVVYFSTTCIIEVDTRRVAIHDGPFGKILPWLTGQETITAGSATVIKRDKEVDITLGETRLIILLHGNAGEKYLWPVLKQQISDNNAEGILAQKPVAYEEVQQPLSTKLKIKDQEISVSRAMAADYSFSPAVILPCWLMSAESALQARLSDFTIFTL